MSLPRRQRTVIPVNKLAFLSLPLFASILGVSGHFAPYDTPMLLRSSRQMACVSSLFKQTASQTEGPYYHKAPTRANITEGKPGVPLALTIAMKNRDCSPFPSGSRVSIWHADAVGAYSGFLTAPDGDGVITNATGSSFLRGEQLSNDDGQVTFYTIVPGWYTSVRGFAYHKFARRSAVDI
jgi:protocatechuate 3,4-dioxygenase beta subunit